MHTESDQPGHSSRERGRFKHTIISIVIGVLVFAHGAIAQPVPDTALLSAARKALPQSLSTNAIRKAVHTGLWNSDRTAVAICVTNSMSPIVWVFLKQTNSQYLGVDVSIQGLGTGFLGIAPRSAYERLELTAVSWLPRDDGMFMVLLRTRVWKNGQRYTVSKPLLIQEDGTVLQQ
jgi:hypothetical protein